jgi:hypothetical protein
MTVLYFVVAVGALALAGYFAVGVRSALSRRFSCRTLAGTRGAGTSSTFNARFSSRSLDNRQLEIVYDYLRAHARPQFDIYPHDRLDQAFGIGTRLGVPLSEALDDLRTLLTLPRGVAATASQVSTVAELVEALDDEAGRAPQAR